MQGLVHARVYGLPYYMDYQSPDLSPAPSCISACHNGKLVTVAGTVVRAQAMQVFQAYKLVQCTKCATAVRLQVCVSNPDAVEMPEQCPQQGCSNSGFRPLEGASVGYTNFQEISITVRINLLCLVSLRPAGAGPHMFLVKLCFFTESAVCTKFRVPHEERCRVCRT
jgi:DNA replicative helicase MCM subunit Mcm2 (Cdc46/Mcm family)